jgi:eukaryotic-like serine/threonine-protein kinase
MQTDDVYILPEGVKLIPVNELGEQDRNRFDHDQDDFVITHSHTRATSKVINAVSASLLKEFREPRTFIEGVLKYSLLNKLNPQAILEDCYPLLAQLRGEGFLLPYDVNGQQSKTATLAKGDFFRDYEIIERLINISDTAVYKIKRENNFYALKILKTKEEKFRLSENYSNEVEILKHLNGKIAPSMIEYGENNNDYYVIMEWCEGNPCDSDAEKYRNLNNEENLDQLLNIATAILGAYSDLHSHGVIHADIHPRNVLVSLEGKVRIIDFGLSRFDSSSKNGMRGGVGFFYEPEYADAMMKNKMPPVSSFTGEQYALAALIYLLITGKHYLNFSFERDILFKQVAQDPPISFQQLDLDINPGIEKAISKALSKLPRDRFGSVAEFGSALRKAYPEKKNNKSFLIAESKQSFIGFCEDIKKKFGFDGRLIENGLRLAPTCSVNYGAAGISYMFYRMACIEEDPKLLALADTWSDRGLAYIKESNTGFYSPELDITPAIVGETSIYHSASGVHLTGALINRVMNDVNGYYRSVMNFITASSRPCENPDVTVGKASTLIGCCILLENLFFENKILADAIKSLGQTKLKEIWEHADSSGPMAGNPSIQYFGIAHGWAGILFATLKWCDLSRQLLPEKFFGRLDELIKLGIKEENFIRWHLTGKDAASWPGWCHGSAGYTFLWTLLYKITREERFMEMAEKTANHFLAIDKNGTNGSLCCGMSGEAYALLSLFKITGNNFYLNEAKALGKRILKNIYGPGMKNNSLYKGDVGAAVLFTELMEPKFALMPLFE